MKRTPAIIVLIALVGLATWYFWPAEESASRLRVTGNIEMTEVQVAFKTPGQIAEINVDEGDFVNAGLLLARLDESELLRQRDEAAAAVRSAEGRVSELKAQREFQRESVAGTVQEREAAVAAAQATLDELLAGTRPQEVEEADAALERARSSLTRAESDLRRARPLLKTEDISAQEFDRIESSYLAARAEVRRAEQRVDLLKEGPRRETISAARSRLNQAQAQLRLARAGSLETRRLDRAVLTSESEVVRSRARVEQIETRLGDTLAKAPIDGVVLVKYAESGEILGAGSPIMTLADYRHPWMRGYIPETLLGRIRLGQEVSVTTDSHPGKVYRGTITYIASEAEFTPRQVLTPEQRSRLVYRIKVSLDNPDGELKLNMPCDAEIPLQPGRLAGRF